MILDDEYWARKSIRRLCELIPNVNVVGDFEDGRKALDFANTTHVDAAIIDILLPNHSGLEIGKTLKSEFPEMNLIFTSAVDVYETQIRKYDGNSFLRKPVELKALECALNCPNQLKQ
ncbi:MAG: response regulator [Lachnospiraceae bacterium]|nr:response regulator [Lachnospiraceae bacterium]